MSLTTSISSYDQQPTYRVYINGAPFYNVSNVQIEASYDSNIGVARVSTPVKFNQEPGMVNTIEIFQGYFGEEVRTFFGYIDDCVAGRFPNEYDLVCRDVLKKAFETWIDDVGVTFTSTQAETAVIALLALAGLSNVQAGTSNFTIGDVHPSEFKLVSVLDACNQIAALIGWALWATADGTVIFDYKKPLPGANVFWTYREASSLTATDGNIIGKFKYTKTDRSLRNRAVIVGWDKIRAVVEADSPYVPTPPQYRTMILSSELIDTQPMANAIAAWMVNDCNHLWESAEFQAPGNPYLRMGHTIRLVESNSGNDANYFVFAMRTEMGKGAGYTMDLTVCGGNSSPFIYPEDQDPVASFTYEQVAWGDPTYVLYVDGSASYCPDATITNWAWSWGDATPDGSGVLATHQYAAPGTVTVTLTVTASNGRTATCSKSIPIGDSTDDGFVYQIIYAGSDAGVWGTHDSGVLWNFSATASRVNYIASNVTSKTGVAIAVCEGGQLYRILNYATSVSLVHTFGAAARVCNVDLQDQTHWLVGLSDGKLYETYDSGATWTLLHTFAGAIAKHMATNPASPTEIFVPVDSSPPTLQHSLDGGSLWSDLLAAWSNGVMTGIKAFAWHMMQHVAVAVTGGTVRFGYSPDNGTSWSSGTGATGTTPTGMTGGANNIGDFIATISGQAYAWVTTDGVAWSAGGAYAAGAFSNDVRYSWRFFRTLLAACE